MMTNKELISGCLRMESGAWVQFLDRYSRAILWGITGRLKKSDVGYTKSDIEDIYQEVLLLLSDKKKFHQIFDLGKLSQWLVVLSGNAAIDYFKRKRQDVYNSGSLTSFCETSTERGGMGIEDNLLDTDSNPAAIAELKEMEDMVSKAVDELPKRCRMIVTMCVFLGKKQRDVAELLKIPQGTVAVYVKRFKEKIRVKLNQSFFS